MKLHYAGTRGEGYGWGTCNAHLIRELDNLIGVEFTSGLGIPVIGRDVAFMPLADHDFNPATKLRGKINLAYTFFESPLGPNAAENAKKYDVVFCGSTWCLDRMRERGITNGEVLIQGVDTNIFKPGERKDDGQFRIFSGGKFEYRKGQDLVIAAFREFVKRHPNAHLVCSWFNPWPELALNMGELMGVPSRSMEFECQEDYFRAIAHFWGVHRNQITVLPPLRHADLAREMANTDCGLFPNRCEGGTNLVLMEYAACGKRIVANTMTGHRDVDYMIHHKLPDTYGENGWAEDTIDEINTGLTAAHLAHALKWENHTPEIPTWEAAAKQILQRAESLLQRL